MRPYQGFPLGFKSLVSLAQHILARHKLENVISGLVESQTIFITPHSNHFFCYQ